MKKLLSFAFALMATILISLTAQAAKVLTVYFSHSGNSKTVAEQIHKNIGGDISEIKTIKQYPINYNACVEQASKEKKANARPKLADDVSNIDSYDVIFLGYPNWWGTIPMAVFTFLEKHNLAGKTIAPFCTHGGSYFGESVNDIKKLCPNSTVLEGLAIRGSDVKNVTNNISVWLQKIGFSDKS